MLALSSSSRFNLDAREGRILTWGNYPLYKGLNNRFNLDAREGRILTIACKTETTSAFAKCFNLDAREGRILTVGSFGYRQIFGCVSISTREKGGF